MKKNFMMMSITAVLFLNVSQANAEETCYAKEHGWIGTCRSSVLAASGTCGEGCTYTYSDNTIYITADNEHYENPQIDGRIFTANTRENNQFTDEKGHKLTITNVLIDGNIKFIGDAFNNADSQYRYTISGKDGTLILDNVGWNAFASNNLTGNIIWRGNSYGGFNHSVKIDGNLIIEDTATVSGSEGNFGLGTNGKVFCNTDMAKCQALLTAAGANNAVLNALQPFPDGCNSLTSSGRCAKCKNNNFNLNDGECDRIRWTPAEAAKVLHDDNTNVVTITFKHK